MTVLVEESTKFTDQDGGIPFSVGITHSQIYGADVIRIEECDTSGDDCWIEMSLEAAELAAPVLQRLIAELKDRLAPKPITKPKK
jgi:hypothetical protein